MIFQAYKMLHPCGGIWTHNQIYLIRRFSSIRVPAGSVRSSFSSALDDVRRLRASGFVASVRVLTPINQQ